MTFCPSKTSQVKTDKNSWFQILNAAMKADECYRRSRQKNTQSSNQANIYLSKVNNRNTRKECETCSKLESCH